MVSEWPDHSIIQAVIKASALFSPLQILKSVCQFTEKRASLTERSQTNFFYMILINHLYWQSFLFQPFLLLGLKYIFYFFV